MLKYHSSSNDTEVIKSERVRYLGYFRKVSPTIGKLIFKQILSFMGFVDQTHYTE